MGARINAGAAFNGGAMKALVYMQIRCMKCRWIMAYGDDAAMVFCANPTCEQFQKEYVTPTIELVPVPAQ